MANKGRRLPTCSFLVELSDTRSELIEGTVKEQSLDLQDPWIPSL